MMAIEIADCVVLGSGPAGSTFASIAKQHDPRARVVVLDDASCSRGPADDALLGEARRLGADVREGARAIAVRRVGRSAAPVVSWEDQLGRKGRIVTDFVLDASGRPLSLPRALPRSLPLGETETETEAETEAETAPDDVVVLGYLRCSALASSATPRIITPTEHGHVWCIPLGLELTAVGVVTSLARADELSSPEALLWQALRSCPALLPLVTHAALRDDVLPGGQRVAAYQGCAAWIARAPEVRTHAPPASTRSACAAPAVR